MKINEERLLGNLRTLRTFTDTPGEGVTRFSYGLRDAQARSFILGRAVDAGCTVDIDSLQNVRIGLRTNRPGRKSVIAGSHIDTVRNGGWLDGIYGVCGALEVMETLAENGYEGGCNYEAVIFAEEEGSGFGSTMTGSKFITGIYDEEDLTKLVRDDGMDLRSVLEGLKDDGAIMEYVEDRQVYNIGPVDCSKVPWDFDKVKTMLELHIEQGPILDREGLQIGIVDSIFGMRVVNVELKGVGNHAGVTPMYERYDALSTAAECLLAAERIVREDPDRRTVVTAGKLEVMPNCSNVIPEEVRFTVEVRDKDNDKIDHYMDLIIEEIKNIADRRKVACHVHEHSKSRPLHLSDRLIEAMMKRAGSKDLKYKKMDSGAVHDACMIAEHSETGMIFVPSIKGRSHVPEEDTRDEDLIAGVEFLLDTVIDEMK